MSAKNLGFQYVVEGQASGEITANAALDMLDSFIWNTVISTTNTPPGSPNDGDCYCIGTSPTGAWVGYTSQLAFCVNGAWQFVNPPSKTIVMDRGAGGLKICTAGVPPTWSIASASKVAITDSTGGSVSNTAASITAGASYAQADMVAVKNALASILDRLNDVRAAVAQFGLRV